MYIRVPGWIHSSGCDYLCTILSLRANFANRYVEIARLQTVRARSVVPKM